MIFLGIDVGGTDTKIGVLDENATVLVQGSTPTGVGRPYQEIIRNMAEYSISLLQTLGLTANDINRRRRGCAGDYFKQQRRCHSLRKYELAGYPFPSGNAKIYSKTRNVG